MSAPVGPIAGALAEHAAVGFGECRCGWTVDVLFGQSWREHHELHQAEAVAALPEVLGRISELERKNTTLGVTRVRLHDALDRVSLLAQELAQSGDPIAREIAKAVIARIVTNPLPSEQEDGK